MYAKLLYYPDSDPTFVLNREATNISYILFDQTGPCIHDHDLAHLRSMA